MDLQEKRRMLFACAAALVAAMYALFLLGLE
jgi:hypothetical protein